MQGLMGMVRSAANALGGGAGFKQMESPKAASFFVPETSSESDEYSGGSDEGSDCDKDSALHLDAPRLRFQIQRTKISYASLEDYSLSVFRWSSKAYVGRRPFCKQNVGDECVKIGPFTIDEIIELVQQAADNAGFSVYLHRGIPSHKPNTAKRLTLNFQCDHGRVRYGKDAYHAAVFDKDVEEVVPSTVMKSKQVRRNHGYKRTVTAHHRHKCVGCEFSFVINGTQEDHLGLHYINKDLPFMWSASTHKLSKSTDEHINHVYRGCCTRMTREVQQYLDANCTSSGASVPELVATIRRTYHVSLDYSRVRYYLLRKGKSLNPVGARGSGDGISGNSLSTIKHLLRTKNSSVVLLLIHCETGQWFNGSVFLESGGNVNITASLYEDNDEAWRPVPFKHPDVDRIVHGTKSNEAYFVHTIAWNYHDSARVFEAYPYTLAMDVQANVNNKGDGLNVIGIDGNFHNIVVMRAFIGSQKSESFRWIFKVAFRRLVKNYRNIRVFFIDGWTATMTELQALCHVNGMFPLARIILCMWHLLTDAYDRKFGYGKSATWFHEFKKLMYRLRRCETQEELDDCAEYVLRRAAAPWPLEENCAELPSTEMVKFIMARLVHSRDWVMQHTLTTVTRGAMTTARVEGDQGHSRNRNINARNSQRTSVMKHEAMHLEKQIKVKHWIDQQLSRKLLRGPTNAASSTITPEILTQLDDMFLPWVVDNFEVQLLLVHKYEVRFTEVNNHKAVFKVFCKPDYDSGDDNECLETNSEIKINDHESADDSSRLSSSDSDEGVGKKMPRDSTEDESRVTFDFDESQQQIFDEVIKNPLTCATSFRYIRVRTVNVDLSDDPLLSVSCSCGYAARIGIACRHELCVIYTVLRLMHLELHPSLYVHNPYVFAWKDFPEVNFADFVNMDICSKVRYHAALHVLEKRASSKRAASDLKDPKEEQSFFALQHRRSFSPKVPALYFRTFLTHIDPDGDDDVPLPGLPIQRHSDGGQRHRVSDSTHEPQQSLSPRRTSARKPQLTERGYMDHVQRIWDKMKRLKDENKAAAHALLQKHLDDADEEISAMHPSKLPRKLTRYFSSSDLMKGRHKQ